MNQTPVSPAKSSSAFRCWFGGMLVVLALLVVILTLGVTSYFRLSSDTRALRNGLLKSSGVDWQQKIALNVGGLTLGVARTGLSLVQLDEHAQAALQSVRSVEVGIYQLSAAEGVPDRTAMLSAADEAMGAGGWERVVVVMAGRKLVAVYAPERNTDAQQLNLCVMAFEGQQMVLASARTNPGPLVQCLLNQSVLRRL